MTAFTILTGVATLVGFVLQVAGLLPQYKKYYLPVTLFLFGLTAGLIVDFFSHVTLHLPENLGTRGIVGIFLFVGSGAIVLIAFLVSILTDSPERRAQANSIGSAVSGFLVFMLMFFSNFMLSDAPSSLRLTYDEQVDVALTSAKKHQFDRSLAMLKNLQSALPDTDKRRSSISKLIDEISKSESEYYRENSVALLPDENAKSQSNSRGEVSSPR